MAFVPAAFAWLGSSAGIATVAAASTAIAAGSAISQRNTQKNMAEFNAKVADQSAEVERQQSGEKQNAMRRKIAQISGTQNAAIAQSGIGFGGSAADLMHQSSVNAELDVLNTKYESDLRARGFGTQALAERYSGRRAASAGYAEAAGSILSGASQYGQYKSQLKSRQLT